MAQNPEKLIVLKLAQQFANRCVPLIERLNSKGFFRIKDQLQGSSTSVPANLAEFCGLSAKGSLLEKLDRCISESNETQTWLDYCADNGIADKNEYVELRQLNVEIRMKLCCLKKKVANSA